MTTGFTDRLKGKVVTANQYTSAGGLFYASVTDNITATPSGSQSTSVVLTSMINRVVNIATSLDGVRLMPAMAGLEITVTNAHATKTCTVFGAGSDHIDAATGATGVVLAATKTANYYCATNGQWHSQVGA